MDDHGSRWTNRLARSRFSKTRRSLPGARCTPLENSQLGRLSHIDGAAARSCITSIDSIGNSAVTTIEAIGKTPAGEKIQKAWLDREVPQCGYCQSGQIMSASALFASNPHPTDADIDDAMSGNICRCGTYVRIRKAIKHAAQSNGQVADHD
jgi:aerobic-type carbon monoxide dehydrogenase small subunit (CoxS/CutS family)